MEKKRRQYFDCSEKTFLFAYLLFAVTAVFFVVFLAEQSAEAANSSTVQKEPASWIGDRITSKLREWPLPPTERQTLKERH